MIRFTCVSSKWLMHVLDIPILSVCPSASLSHAGIVSKRLNILSCFLHHTIAHIHSSFCVYKDLREIPTGSPPAEPLNRGGVWECRNFRPNFVNRIRKCISVGPGMTPSPLHVETVVLTLETCALLSSSLLIHASVVQRCIQGTSPLSSLSYCIGLS